jgi:hypothetical protein
MNELINNEMNFPVPEGFAVLSEEELAKLKPAEGTVEFAVRNEPQHILMNVAHRTINGLFAKIVDLRDAVRNQEKSIAKLSSALNYSCIGFNDYSIGGHEAKGFTYTYDVQGIEMQATSIITSNGKTFYYIYAYYRKANAEESLKTVNSILEGISWK